MTTITVPRAVIDQTLEAIESDFSVWTEKMIAARTALKAALAQQAEPVEPVAWVHTDAYNPKVRFLEWTQQAKGYRGDWIKTPLCNCVQPQQAEPVDTDCHTQGICQRSGYGITQQAEPLTIYRLRDALVASRIIPPAAVEDPEGYDDGVTLHRIQGLHRRIT